MSGTFPSWFDARAIPANAGTVLVGVSGGPDSMVLLSLVLAWSRTSGERVIAVHVNHGTRGTRSDSDETFVREACARLGVTVRVDRLSLGPGRSEEEMRNARYRCFRRAGAVESASCLLLGHHADDLAETFLFHLFRGAGLDGLTFEPARKEQALVIGRPLWHAGKEEILGYASTHSIPFVRDDSNEDSKYARNALRHVIIPEIRRLVNPDAVDGILRSARNLFETREIVRDQVGQVLTDAGTAHPDVYRMDVLASLSDGMLSEVIRRVCRDQAGINAGTEIVHRIRKSVRAGIYDEIALGKGCWLILEDRFAWLCRLDEKSSCILPEQVAGRASKMFPEHFSAKIETPVLLKLEAGRKTVLDVPLLDGDRVRLVWESDRDANLEIRNRRPGDLWGDHRTLKKRMIDCHVPRYRRDFLVVAAAGNRVLSVVDPAFSLRNRNGISVMAVRVPC